MATVKIKRVQHGVNEEGFPIIGPETQPPAVYTACEITPTEYVYTVPDANVPAAEGAGGDDD